MTQVLTSTDIARTLAQLGRDLDAAVDAIREADHDATQKRAAFDLAYSKSFVRAEGSMDVRRHLAVIETHQLRVDADVAEALVRHLKRRIDAISKRIEVGRSIGTSMRAELSLAGSRDML
jgi:hypothetical protein